MAEYCGREGVVTTASTVLNTSAKVMVQIISPSRTSWWHSSWLNPLVNRQTASIPKPPGMTLLLREKLFQVRQRGGDLPVLLLIEPRRQLLS